jgi:hypothetical protein
MLTAMGEVVRRGGTGEGSKVVDEVRLIEVTASQSQLRPFHVPFAPDETYDLLKAQDAAEQLGRQPDLFAEELDEPPLAQTGPFTHFLDRAACTRHTLELSQREGYGGMVGQRTCDLRQKSLFEDAKPGLGRLGFE